MAKEKLDEQVKPLETTPPPAAVVDDADETGGFSSTRPTTDANVWIQIVGAVICTMATCYFLYFWGHNAELGSWPSYLNALVNQRGPVQWLELLCFYVIIFFLFQKNRILRNQIKHIAADSAKVRGVNMESEEEIQALRRRIQETGGDKESVLLSRLNRALGLWVSTKDLGRVTGWIGTEAGRDSTISDMTFTLVRLMMWVIPILGFIGTVQGLGAAVGGFANFLSGSAELSAIKGAIANVTISLGVAFDTTFLALMLVTVVQFPLTSLMRRESTFMAEVDIYLDEHFIRRLPSAEQQPVVIENLEDSIEAAFRRYIPDPDRYEEVFTVSIEKAGDELKRQFEELTRRYVEVRQQATDDEVKALAAAMEHAHKRAAEMADRYARSADSIQATLGESLQKAANAAGVVEQQITTIMDLGAKIQELLKVEQALERAMAGIAGSEEFRLAFSQLREHLATTDEFCRRLSKPRVITLHEEVIS
ncbi:MAG TPA: hypothetical protein PLD40_08530 [Kiritimatiellia bacterium]|jgi:hypothetical protein|nr:hypothetical protein [Kiritimatiellia bacterium]HOE00956.1 hypothetical protein [Kiritimatiellia bacterium]HOE37355.1 hypothetical protein [Kiritimatiellia bacterium]HOR74758.1 hypothetical protein [Kiritimatiellia bacterium]HOU59233.1 hypothetical protein [Kiritimatiellia bacterium]